LQKNPIKETIICIHAYIQSLHIGKKERRKKKERTKREGGSEEEK